ncbi:MAG: N-acetylglucosamine-6-phosphate deacetylase [Pseudomonadota bacterium]
MSQHLSGRIVTEAGVVDGAIKFDATVESIDAGGSQSSDIIVPGFIDLHVHGGGGADVMEGADSVRAMARLHGQHGTTSLLATTMTAIADEVIAGLKGIAEAMAAPNAESAEILAAHLEGPFISPNKLGAQPDEAIGPDLELLRRMTETCPIKVATIAPDMGGDDPIDGSLFAEFTSILTSHGARVQLGHSPCTYDVAVASFERGASGVTHMFNAMSSLHHRSPGLAGAALAHAEYGELIPDLMHVHPGAMRVGLRAIPKLYAITDATAATGMPDGDYRLGRHTVRKCDNGVRLEDGTLAGSALTMDQAFANLIGIGLDLTDAAKRTSTFAADYLGLTDRGRLTPGLRADLAVFDDKMALKRVYKKGRIIHDVDA